MKIVIGAIFFCLGLLLFICFSLFVPVLIIITYSLALIHYQYLAVFCIALLFLFAIAYYFPGLSVVVKYYSRKFIESRALPKQIGIVHKKQESA